MDVDGVSAVVTGGASGLGAATAAALHDRGAKVFVLDLPGAKERVDEDGATFVACDVILWCTGFRSSLDHLAPLLLREPSGGITMTGRLATQVAHDPRIHLVGYGPSASTIGANRAGAAAASELMGYLELP